MPAKNISFNTPNHAKFNELMKATGKPTRQAAIADVLRNASELELKNDNAKVAYKTTYDAYAYYLNKSNTLSENITLYRTALVVLAFIAVTGWVL